MSSISAINTLALPAGVQPLTSGAKPTDFGSVLADVVKHVGDSQTSSQQSVDRFLAGEGEELHSVALGTQRAELEFELLLQVRNKVVSAYQEIMRMQI